MFVIVGIILICAIYFLFAPCKSNFIKNSKDIVLFVTAHPDDECMFFAPTILNLLKEDYCIYLLCLSAVGDFLGDEKMMTKHSMLVSGGFYNQSVERKSELRQSCKILGIPSENVIIVEHSKLPDDPDLIWNKGRVAQIIRKYFIQLSAKIIFSFDEYGVSGHLNHIAIHKGLEYLKTKDLLPRDSQVFLLKTVFLLQKYLCFLTAPLCQLNPNVYFISALRDVQKTWLSMKAHRSQFVWFRKLYIIFSRYVYINTFTELIVHDKDR